MDNAFKVTKDGQVYDYRVPHQLNIADVTNFFSTKYKVSDLKQTGRHVTGILNDGKQDLFLKLSTTKGISIITQNEYKWNEEFGKNETSRFEVPHNVTFGEYNELYYFLTEILKGEPFATTANFTLSSSFEPMIPEIIDFADFISTQMITGVGRPDVITGKTPQEWFVNKTKSWLDAIPVQTQAQFGLIPLFAKVESDAKFLLTKPRHGDFTPWHLLKTPTGLGLLDGEHAMSEGVELYDIGYLIQRVHSISKNAPIAQKVLTAAEGKGHPLEKIKTILAARAIGGFLDAHLAGKTDFSLEKEFKDWISSL